MFEPSIANPLSKQGFLKLTIFCFLCILAVWYIPKLDKALFPSHVKPGSLTVLGLGLVMTLFTAGVIYFGIRSYLDLPKKFFLFTFLYNALIVVVKFTISPFLIYNSSGFGSGLKNDGLTFTMISAFVFLLYFVVFFGMYLYFRRQVKKAIEIDDSKSHKAIRFFGMTLLGGIVVLAAMSPLIFTIFSLGYLSFVFSTVLGGLIALALLGAILFLKGAFKSVVERTIALRDVTYLVSFFWIGVAFLLVYHALWVVYLLVLVALWPLRVVSPK